MCVGPFAAASSCLTWGEVRKVRKRAASVAATLVYLIGLTEDGPACLQVIQSELLEELSVSLVCCLGMPWSRRSCAVCERLRLGTSTAESTLGTGYVLQCSIVSVFSDGSDR